VGAPLAGHLRDRDAPRGVLGLRWSDLRGDEITVRRSVVGKGAGQPVVNEPKTAAGVRSIALDPDTLARLRSAREQADSGADGWLFPGPRGVPMTPDYVTRLFGETVTRVGLPAMPLHDARHAHATTLLRAGVPVHEVVRRLGHADPSVLQRVYAHAIPGDDHRVASAWAAAVDRPQNVPDLASPMAQSGVTLRKPEAGERGVSDG
jgi:integrase